MLFFRFLGFLAFAVTASLVFLFEKPDLPKNAEVEKRVMLDNKPERTIDATAPSSFVAHLEDPKTKRTATAQLAFSPDSKCLAVRVGGGYFIQLWNLKTRQLDQRLEVADSFFAMAFSPKKDVLFTGHATGKVRLWSVTNGQLLETWEPVEKPAEHIDGLAASPDGKWLVSCARLPTLWNLETKKGQLLDLDLQYEFHQDLRHVAFAADSRHFVTAMKRFLIWEVATAKVLREAKGNEGASCYCLAVAPDGKSFATGCNIGGFMSLDGAVLQMWDMKSCAEIGGAREFCYSAFSITFSPDNKHLLAAGSSGKEGKRGCVYIWTLATGKMTKVIVYERDAARLVVSPDGKWLATGAFNGDDAHGVRLYELEALLRPLKK